MMPYIAVTALVVVSAAILVLHFIGKRQIKAQAAVANRTDTAEVPKVIPGTTLPTFGTRTDTVMMPAIRPGR